MDIAKKLSIPFVVTNDSHYTYSEDRDAHAALLCVQTGKTLADPNRFKFDGTGYHLKSPDEMRAIDSSDAWQEGCRNTLLVAEKVDTTGMFAFQNLMPRYPTPEGKTEADYFRDEDVNESEREFVAVGNDIRFGLGAIRNVGANVVDAIIRTRMEKGKFADFADFLRKVDVQACNKKVVESLIKAGAFDSLGHPRKGLHMVHVEAVDAIMLTKKEEARGQFDLFGDGGGDDAGVFDVKIPDEHWEPKHQLTLEREMLGLYVSGHPLNGVEQLLGSYSDTSIPRILEGDVPDGTQVTLGGILASVTRRVNKNGEPWASAQLEDLAGGIEVLFFPKSYMVHGMSVAEDAIVLVKARVAKREDRISLIANDLVVPDLSELGAQALKLKVAASRCDPKLVTSLKEVLSAHPGTTEVHLNLVINSSRNTLLKLDDALRVTPTPSLMGDLKALLGPGCLG
jgi:DNA polymerase-3 subunit alpha